LVLTYKIKNFLSSVSWIPILPTFLSLYSTELNIWRV
jgi:hypothetical protein